jgi:hypothetical protein
MILDVQGNGFLEAYDELRWRKVLGERVWMQSITAFAAGPDDMGIDHLIHCMIPLEFPL